MSPLLRAQVCTETLTLPPGTPTGISSACRGQRARYVLIRRITANQPAGLVLGLPICAVQVWDVLPPLAANLPAEDGRFATQLVDANGDLIPDVVTHRCVCTRACIVCVDVHAQVCAGGRLHAVLPHRVTAHGALGTVQCSAVQHAGRAQYVSAPAPSQHVQG